jgi:SAM-dependent methyltransferase
MAADVGASPPECSIIQRAVLRRVQRLGLPGGTKVLDAPCGNGALALALAGEGLEVWGADIEPQPQVWLGERFRAADLDGSLPWPAASFDLLLCIEGIEHLENRFHFLREAYRLLTPQGRLLLTTPNTVSLRSRVRFLGSGFFHRDSRPLPEAARHPLHHIGLLTYTELRYSLHTSGFRIIEVGHTHTKAVSYPYGLYIPWMWLYTRLAFRKEKDPAQRACNREILRSLFSHSLLFGENVMVIATKS